MMLVSNLVPSIPPCLSMYFHFYCCSRQCVCPIFSSVGIQILCLSEVWLFSFHPIQCQKLRTNHWRRRLTSNPLVCIVVHILHQLLRWWVVVQYYQVLWKYHEISLCIPHITRVNLCFSKPLTLVAKIVYKNIKGL